ncbi:unnamed protein product [Kluyveromyces dobzhanskii CBS 2104]|uniref:WGS project CCBQ000000000 data, contig 00015 n=1 Tax=Kluyveromyces dobzhanskii CBS 2104 TaxID=1427455 RepID=A0A0A8LCC9_9SACH|nr:unnamed protein product [Kluyveromyces dobzhanskii CBS 2104]
MLFGVRLANDTYPPWRDSYIDYEKLKKLLKESIIRDSEMYNGSSNRAKNAKKNKTSTDEYWSEKDESKFVSALDEELEKVYGFQTAVYNKIMNTLNKLEEETESDENLSTIDFQAFHQQLEECLSQAQELDNFQRLNFTGFTKIVKKHDKLHPGYPSVKSLLQVRLRSLPFHSEEYSPLLYKISYLYNILRNNFSSVSKSLANSSKLSSMPKNEQTSTQSFKFWIHQDNLMEVKTNILRRLPVLVYAQPPSENDDLIDRLESNLLNDDGGPAMSSSSNETDVGHLNKSFEPVISTLYFDNEFFELYNGKLLKANSAPTVRLRWIGKLNDKPDIFLEKRMYVDDDESGCTEFEENRVKLKQKFINGFIFNGDTGYKEMMLKKLKESGSNKDTTTKLENNFDSIQQFILENELQPVLRTLYQRTAFQIPGDDRVRITIDSDILYIREDSFDKDRPIRNPKHWHRSDIDSDVAQPLKFIRPGEDAKFPYSVMEIKVKTSASSISSSENALSVLSHGGNQVKWIADLANSHLVKEVPKFSKYVQGVASLFGEDEKLDMLPFWLPDLEFDIRKDPNQAYEEEKKKLERQQEHTAKMNKMKRLSVVAGNSDQNLQTSTANRSGAGSLADEQELNEDEESSEDENTSVSQNKGPSNSRKSKQHRYRHEPNIFNVLTGRDNTSSKLTGIDSEDEEIELPPGVKKPTSYIKNAGPIKVEAKVWLANERTFNKWLSVTTLLSVLTFSISSSVKKANMPVLAEWLTYFYFGLTVFTGLWAYKTYMTRLNVIKERSGKHLDAPFGPLAVSFVVSTTLIINFVVAFRELIRKPHELASSPFITSAVETIGRIVGP